MALARARVDKYLTSPKIFAGSLLAKSYTDTIIYEANTLQQYSYLIISHAEIVEQHDQL